MRPYEIEKIRDIWEAQMKQPEFEEVMDLITNTHAVKFIYDGSS